MSSNRDAEREYRAETRRQIVEIMADFFLREGQFAYMNRKAKVNRNLDSQPTPAQPAAKGDEQ